MTNVGDAQQVGNKSAGRRWSKSGKPWFDRTPEDRFWEKVAVGDGCWLWTAARFGTGYGAIRIDGVTVKAHRFSYELHFGPIPPGMFVCHRCDVPLCVSPEHLFLGNDLVNMRDMIAKGRSVHHNGERATKAKLTEDQVREIRRAYLAGDGSMGTIGARFGVGKGAVMGILSGRNWRHVALPGVRHRHRARSLRRRSRTG